MAGDQSLGADVWKTALARLLAIGCFLVLAVAWCLSTFAQQQMYLAGVVKRANGKGLPHVSVRVVNVGGTTTSQTGEFLIPLGTRIAPGDPVVLEVGGWVILEPYVGSRGRMHVPRSSTEPIVVRVVRKGAPELLHHNQVQRIVMQVIDNPHIEVMSKSELLEAQAKGIGVPFPKLRAAVDDWIAKVKGPYERGIAAFYRGDYSQAAEMMRKSTEVSEADLTEKYVLLGQAQYALANYSSAEEALRKAALLRPGDPRVKAALATVLVFTCRSTEGAQLYKQALETDEKLLGPSDIRVASDMNGLGIASSCSGRHREAAAFYRKAISICQESGSRFGVVCAMMLTNLGNSLDMQGDYKEAEAAYLEALRIHRTGPYDKDSLNLKDELIASDEANLAIVYLNQGRLAEAEALQSKVLGEAVRLFGPDHPHVADTHTNLGNVMVQERRYDEAEMHYKRALAIDRQKRGPATVAGDLMNLGLLFANQQKWREAEQYYRSAMLVIDEAHVVNLVAAKVAERLCEALSNLGRQAEAEEFAAKARAIRLVLNPK